MPDEQNFPEPGSLAADQNIHGPAGPNGESPHMSPEAYAVYQAFQSKANAAGTPPPPGFASYEQWATSVTLSLVQKLAADAGIS